VQQRTPFAYSKETKQKPKPSEVSREASLKRVERKPCNQSAEVHAASNEEHGSIRDVDQVESIPDGCPNAEGKSQFRVKIETSNLYNASLEPKKKVMQRKETKVSTENPLPDSKSKKKARRLGAHSKEKEECSSIEQFSQSKDEKKNSPFPRNGLVDYQSMLRRLLQQELRNSHKPFRADYDVMAAKLSLTALGRNLRINVYSPQFSELLDQKCRNLASLRYFPRSERLLIGIALDSGLYVHVIDIDQIDETNAAKSRIVKIPMKRAKPIALVIGSRNMSLLERDYISKNGSIPAALVNDVLLFGLIRETPGNQISKEGAEIAELAIMPRLALIYKHSRASLKRHDRTITLSYAESSSNSIHEASARIVSRPPIALLDCTPKLRIYYVSKHGNRSCTYTMKPPNDTSKLTLLSNAGLEYYLVIVTTLKVNGPDIFQSECMELRDVLKVMDDLSPHVIDEVIGIMSIGP